MAANPVSSVKIVYKATETRENDYTYTALFHRFEVWFENAKRSKPIQGIFDNTLQQFEALIAIAGLQPPAPSDRSLDPSIFLVAGTKRHIQAVRARSL
jgi:hypothetical protein